MLKLVLFWLEMWYEGGRVERGVVGESERNVIQYHLVYAYSRTCTKETAYQTRCRKWSPFDKRCTVRFSSVPILSGTKAVQ